MYTILLITTCLLMAKLFRERCLRGRRIHINVFFGLLLGIGTYVLLPCVFVAYAGDALADLTVYARVLTVDNATLVLAFTTALLLALWSGARLAGPSLRRRAHARHPRMTLLGTRWKPPSTDAATYLLVLAFGALLVLAIDVSEFLLVGYDSVALESDVLWSARGAMSSFYSLTYLSICAIVLRSRTALSRTMRCTMVLIFIVSSVLLLSLGARLYVAMALLSLLALRSALLDGISQRALLLFVLSAAAVFGLVGVVRSGSLTGLGSVLLNLALEPILTSISLFTLVNDNSMILFGKPHLFFADFQAVLPSFLFPEKAALFDRLATYGYEFEAPVGGYHLYFSTLINFGVAGSTLLAAPLGYFLATLSSPEHLRRRSTVLMAVFLPGAFAFTLFRDPFFISIVKNILVVGILAPLALWPNDRFAPAIRARRRPAPTIADAGSLT